MLFAGDVKKLRKFEFGVDTGLYESCSVQYEDKMLVFGGNQNPRTIAEVVDCGTKKIGILPMEFSDGGCNHFDGYEQGPRSVKTRLTQIHSLPLF